MWLKFDQCVLSRLAAHTPAFPNEDLTTAFTTEETAHPITPDLTKTPSVSWSCYQLQNDTWRSNQMDISGLIVTRLKDYVRYWSYFKHIHNVEPIDWLSKK